VSEFQLLKVSDRALFWYEVAAYIAPYATVGSFILSGLSLHSEHAQERRLAEISRKLDEIKMLIIQARRALEEKLNDIPIRERTGEVLGIEEALNEYRGLQSQGVLDNIITDSAQTKRKIKAYIESEDTPLSYLAAYCGLYITLLPLRIAGFELFDRPVDQINALVSDELQDIVRIESIAIRSAERVGASRVSPRQEETFLFDELGPVYGTNFFVQVDNARRTLGTFIPRYGNLNELRAAAQDMRDAIAAQKAAEAAAPFRRAIDAAKEAIVDIG